jgi:DNA-binding response OmpR family regulator
MKILRRVLVVDDDPHIGLAIRAWLKRYGFRVSIADGGTKGLAALEKVTFDLMIVPRTSLCVRLIPVLIAL